jgi:hypothetical protein
VRNRDAGGTRLQLHPMACCLCVCATSTGRVHRGREWGPWRGTHPLLGALVAGKNTLPGSLHAASVKCTMSWPRIAEALNRRYTSLGHRGAGRWGRGVGGGAGGLPVRRRHGKVLGSKKKDRAAPMRKQAGSPPRRVADPSVPCGGLTVPGWARGGACYKRPSPGEQHGARIVYSQGEGMRGGGGEGWGLGGEHRARETQPATGRLDPSGGRAGGATWHA